MLRWILASLLSLPASCVIARQDVNEPIDASLLSRLCPGTTTAHEAAAALGAPTEVVQLGRRVAWRYDATTTKSAGLFLLLINFAAQDTRSDRLWLFFDEREVLTHFGRSFGVHRTQYALPWEDVHEAEENAAADAVRPGLGTR